MNDPRGIAFSRVQLDKIKVATQRRISNVVLHDLTVSSWEDFLTNDMVIAMEACVLGKRQSSEPETSMHTVVFARPASWWQHFKQSAIANGNPFFDPAKVRMVEECRQAKAVVTRNRAIVWPEFNIVLPPEVGRSVTVAMPSTVDWIDPR